MTRKGLQGGNFKPLSEEAIEKIHETAMRVIEEVGFETNSRIALDLFRDAGAWVDEERRLVRIRREMATELMEKAPSKVMLCGQEEKHDLILGGARVYAGTGGTALYVIDLDTLEKRQATLADLKQIARLVHGLDNVHLFMLPTYPCDLPLEKVDVNRFFAGLDNTSKHIMGGVYTLEGIRQVIKMAEIIAGSEDKLRQRPLVSMVTCSISPLKMDRLYGDMLATIARAGIPLVCPAEPLCGATSPVTLAGNIVVQTVDSLMGVFLAQLANPGTPVIFGSVATSADLGDLKYLSGSIEMGLLNAAGAQMAQFYKLPFYATGGMSDAKLIDAQCGYESALTALLPALAGANFIHDAAGLMEFALTMNYGKLVVDNEILGMVMRAVEGIRVNDETLAFELIKEVGPGGHFVSSRHTRRFMRGEHYQPALSDRSTREQWIAEGSKNVWHRARERAQEILRQHNFSLSAPVRERVLSEIEDIVD